MNKKIFSKLTAAVLMALAGMGIASCGSDDDEPEAPAVWSSSYVVKFELSDDVLNTADVTANIVKPDGTFHQEKVTKNTCSWTMTGDKLPDKAGVLLTFVPKDNIDENKVYDIAMSGGITVTSLKDKGVVNHKSYSGDSEISIKGDKLAQYYVGHGIGFAHGVGAKGELVSVDIDSFDFGLNGVWEWIAGFFVESDDK